MKFVAKILTALTILFISGLFVTNAILKAQFEKLDKSDLYWNFKIVLSEPYHHLKLEGGNMTNIAFEPSPKSTVRVNPDWNAYKNGNFKPYVKNDTLHLVFDKNYSDLYEKNWLRNNIMVRIFTPELLSVTGSDTRLVMKKVKQPNFTLDLSGTSEFELESQIPEFDSLKINQRDSSEVVFEMIHENGLSRDFHCKWIEASVKGKSILGLGDAKIDSFKISVDNRSAILLSGESLKMWKK